jgi:hypothetical protein
MGTRREMIVANVVVGGAMAMGAWFAFQAWKLASLPLANSAAIVLLATPVIVAMTLLARANKTRCTEGTPFPQLVEALSHADVALRIIRIARANAFVGASYAVVLWFCQGSGLIDARGFVWSITLITTAAVACLVPWLARLEKRAYEQRETSRHLLREFRTANRW